VFRLSALIVLALVACGIAPLFFRLVDGDGLLWPDPTIWRVLRFTVLQAALSTVLSVVPGLLAARALVSEHFPGRRHLLVLMGVPQALPAIVVVLAITSMLGANGFLSGAVPLYGWVGILFAHLFFNFPLATRLFVQAYDSIPAESLRLAEQLALPPLAHFKLVEWPHLRAAFFSAMFLIFMLCAASFVIVLTLGGGPQFTTLEVAIFQSMRMDFDLARALSLASMQIALSLGLIFLLRHFSVPAVAHRSLQANTFRALPSTAMLSAVSFAALVICVLLVAAILLSVVGSGAFNLAITSAHLRAVMTSFAVGSFAALISVALAYGLAHQRNGASIAALGIIVPPAILATGWFILAIPFAPGVFLTGLMIVLLNSLLALPFAHAMLAPAYAQHFIETRRLSHSLGLSGWSRFRIVDWPALRRPLAHAALMAFVLSLGDLAAILMVGSQGILTLPGLIHAQMGRYQFDQAFGTALWLAALCFFFTWLAERVRTKS
jgi:thiamine transport system permease protein